MYYILDTAKSDGVGGGGNPAFQEVYNLEKEIRYVHKWLFGYRV